MVDRFQHGVDQMHSGDAAAPLVGGVDGRLVQGAFHLSAGAVAQQLRQVGQGDVRHRRLAGKIAADDLLPVRTVGALYLDLPVKPPAPQQGIGELLHVVGGGDHEHLLLLHLVDAALHRCKRGGAELVAGELVHVVQQEHGRRGLRRLVKRVRQLLQEFVLHLAAPHGEAGQAAVLHQRRGHQCFAQAGFAGQQQTLRQLCVQRRVNLRMVDHIADLHQLRLDVVVADDPVKCAHISTSSMNRRGYVLAKRANRQFDRLAGLHHSTWVFEIVAYCCPKS